MTLLLVLPVQVHGSDRTPDVSIDSSEVVQPETKIPPKVGEEIVVTATRGERPANAVPISVTMIPAKEIRSAPAVRVDDFLREVPGVDIPLGSSAVQYPTLQTISMRGLGGNRALVLLDGIPMNDPASGYAQWSKVPLSSIDRIEVARGGAASLFGNYALGGTIQLFSRALDDHLEGEVSYGSYATRNASFSVGKKLTERFAIGVDAHLFDSAGYDRVPQGVRGPVDTPTASDNATVQLRSEVATDRTRSFMRGRFFTENLSLGTPISKNARDIFDLAAGTHVAIGSGDLSVTLFHQNQEFWVQNTSLIRRDSEFVLNRRTTPIHDTGAAIQWSHAPGQRVSFLTAGLDLRQISLSEHGINYDSAGNVTLLQDVGGTQDFAGLFGEATFMITSRLELFTSARVDWWKNRDGFDERNVGANTEYPSKSSTELDPRIALRYAMSPSTSLRGAVYRAFRAPTISELYRKTEAKAQVNLPNPNLGPEILIGGDVGVDARIAGTDTSINVFHNEIDGLIGRIPLQTTPVLTQLTVNVGKTRSRGVEAMASRNLSPRWAMKMGLAFTDAITVSNPADPTLEGRRTAGVSRHVETLSVRYQRENGFAVTVRGRQVGKRYVDAANVLELDAHVVVDLFASMPLSGSAELFLIGENLFNDVYLADVGAAQRLGAPAQLFGGVRMRVRRAHD